MDGRGGGVGAFLRAGPDASAAAIGIGRATVVGIQVGTPCNCREDMSTIVYASQRLIEVFRRLSRFQKSLVLTFFRTSRI